MILCSGFNYDDPDGESFLFFIIIKSILNIGLGEIITKWNDLFLTWDPSRLISAE